MMLINALLDAAVPLLTLKLGIYEAIELLFLMPGLYVFARLAVLLPSTAIGERHDMKWAWDVTADNGWRLVVVVGLFPALLTIISDVFISTRHVLISVIATFISYFFVMIEITALSLSFQFLSRDDKRVKMDHLSPITQTGD